MLFVKKITEINSQWKIAILRNYFDKHETVLDFGCGDLSFAQSLKKQFPKLAISGVDVVEFSKLPKNFKFTKYNGTKLPFKNNSFDTVIAFYVFHHCTDAKVSFKECLRVAKKRVIIIESLPQNKFAIPLMKFMDWFYNAIKFNHISHADQFFSLQIWMDTFRKAKVKKINRKEFKPLISFIPTGKQYLFEVIK